MSCFLLSFCLFICECNYFLFGSVCGVFSPLDRCVYFGCVKLSESGAVRDGRLFNNLLNVNKCIFTLRIEGVLNF